MAKIAIVIVLASILLLLVSHGADGSLENASPEINASEILAKIQNGAPVEYDHVIVKGDLNINKSNSQKNISSPIRINDSIFDGEVNFNHITLDDLIDLSGSNFIKDASFVATVFGGGANFDGANFEGEANFRNSKFSGISFIRVKVFRDYGIDTYVGDAFFVDATFRKNAIFTGAKFSSDAYFVRATFNGLVSFWEAAFSGGATFIDATFNEDADFKRAVFSSNAIFDNSEFNKVAVFDDATFNGYLFGWSSIENALTCDKAAYLRMIQNFKEHGQSEEADDCYYAYRCHNMNSVYDFISLISCGYGVRPLHTIYLGFVLIAIFAFFYWISNGVHKSSIHFEEKVSNVSTKWSLSSISNLFIIWVKKLFSFLIHIPNIILRYLRSLKMIRLSEIPGKIWHKSFTTDISFRDALYFSAISFLTLHPPHNLEHSTQWRYIVLLEAALGAILIALFVVTLGNVIINY